MLVCAIILVVLFIIVIRSSFLKFKVKNPYKQDQLIQKEKDDKKLTFLYKLSSTTLDTTLNNISRYTVVSDNGDRNCVVSYEKKFDNILYYVYMYRLSGKLIGVMQVEEQATDYTSEPIKLPSACKKLNIVVSKIDGEIVNTNIVKTLSFAKLFMYALFESTFLGLLMYTASSFIFDVSSKLSKIYLIIFGVISFVNFVILLLVLIKNNKLRKG